MSKSASLPAELFENPQQPQGTPGWKEEVNQRLAAHRNRRGSAQEASGSREAQGARAASDRAAAAAARVAARYAKAPSYSELLAGEARAVVRAAGAAAEAARSAQAAAQAVLAGLEAGLDAASSAADPYWRPAPPPPAENTVGAQSAARWQDEPAPAPAPRWQEEPSAPAGEPDVWSEMRVYPAPAPAHTFRPEAAGEYRRNRGEAQEYEASDADLFTADPYAAAVVEPVQHLPANLIEFPRELVATRKARPRLAEGPFYNPAQEQEQLNIFEAAQLNEAAAPPVAPPEWASIELEHARHDADPGLAAPAQAYTHMPEMLSAAAVEEPAVEDEQADSSYSFTAAPYPAVPYEAELPSHAAPAEEIAIQAAPAQPVRKAAARPAAVAAPELLVAAVSDRMLATVVDAALVTLAYLAAAVVVLASTSHPPAGRIALVASACGVALFWVLYQFLFLSYAEEGTPGMRYARIALCTFDDDNPSLAQMRMRIPAMILAALPAGLGLAWALWDKDHLGWQDRLTKTYQRKY